MASERRTDAANAWAVIIGIDSYPAPTGYAIGSVADAHMLAATLLARGWHPDRILLLRDAHATRKRVTEALRWLAARTDESSTVVLHYSGHGRDGSLVLADNKRLGDRELSVYLRGIRSRSMWIDVVACHAGAVLSRYALKRGDVATLSSRAGQDSYGDVTLGQSIFGHYAIAEAIGLGLGDANRDGSVSVKEAFAYARHRVETHTAGRQIPVIETHGGEDFSLDLVSG